MVNEVTINVVLHTYLKNTNTWNTWDSQDSLPKLWQQMLAAKNSLKHVISLKFSQWKGKIDKNKIKYVYITF